VHGQVISAPGHWTVDGSKVDAAGALGRLGHFEGSTSSPRVASRVERDRNGLLLRAARTDQFPNVGADRLLRGTFL